MIQLFEIQPYTCDEAKKMPHCYGQPLGSKPADLVSASDKDGTFFGHRDSLAVWLLMESASPSCTSVRSPRLIPGFAPMGISCLALATFEPY